MNRIEVRTEVTGTVWKIEVKDGDSVNEGDEIMILESMKMEIAVLAPAAGRIAEIKVAEEQYVEEGDIVAIIETVT